MQIRWYAGAAAAAGVTVEGAQPSTASVRATLVELHPSVAPILDRCTILVDGSKYELDGPWPADALLLDVLPPFSGG